MCLCVYVYVYIYIFSEKFSLKMLFKVTERDSYKAQTKKKIFINNRPKKELMNDNVKRVIKN